MYRIGDFSIISQVSVKMLRHYDELGLLKPAEVDRFTSYRYYSLDQLPRLNRIMALKAMGFSLIEIRDLLDTPPSVDTLRAQAAAKETELTQQLETLREKMAHLKTWMHRIEFENMMPEYEIILKPLPLQGRPTLPTPTAEKLSLPLPTQAGLETDVLLERASLPAADVLACTLHSGTLEDLVQAYVALDQWIRAHGYQIIGPPRELRLSEEMSGLLIEVQMPIRTAP